MLKNRIFRRLALLFSVLMLLTSTVNSTFCFIVTQTGSIVNTFVPFYGAVGNLILSKSVQHPLGEDYVIPEHISFDFQVCLGAYYANSTIKTTAGNVTADENGMITVSVKPGQNVGIEGVNAGTKVSVTELQKDGDGFTVKDGIATQEATVLQSINAAVEFTNIYDPLAVQPVNVTVTGTKILEGRQWQAGDSFSFTLEQRTEEGQWLNLGTRTVAYDAQSADFNTFDFTETLQTLTFDRVGNYTFRMKEVVGQHDDIDYDKSINTFKVTVTDTDMDGKLEIGDVTAAQNAKVTQKDGVHNVSVTFNNTYIPAVPDPEDIAVTVTVNKTVNNTGDSTIGPGGFWFVLEDNVTGLDVTKESNEAGKAVFTLPFTVADIGKTYTYKLSEIDEGMPGVTYDTTVYDISVSVALSEDNELVAFVTINGETAESLTVDFVNTYYIDPFEPIPTGDDMDITFWFLMMIVSGSACIFLVAMDRKYQSMEKRK